MGDIVHALPAVMSLKRRYPGAEVTWVVEPKWRDLLDGGGAADEIVEMDRRRWGTVWRCVRTLRREPFDAAVDMQGLMKSALVTMCARTNAVFGYDVTEVREKPAAVFYSRGVKPRSAHIVDRHMDLVESMGVRERVLEFPLPQGREEGVLPRGRFVLASPLAGWGSKQWPLENWTRLAKRLGEELGMALVVNGAPSSRAALQGIEAAALHLSSVAGLLWATRKAACVVGVDSGPMHVAAALGKPGVALFGPTDPARNGPYGGTFTVLRSPGAATSYKRGVSPDESMAALQPDAVFAAVKEKLQL
jgi:heptosyltransferase-1